MGVRGWAQRQRVFQPPALRQLSSGDQARCARLQADGDASGQLLGRRQHVACLAAVRRRARKHVRSTKSAQRVRSGAQLLIDQLATLRHRAAA